RRIEALGILHSEGIPTFVMIAPLLPGAEGLADLLKGKVDHVLIDRLNYHYADRALKEHGLQWAGEAGFFAQKGEELRDSFEKQGIACRMLF
ncbi:MAG TPA: radical SAM protein, partial [Nitrospirota bacterium]|nr:radical SAM protein [Nitrospirota bacterium]